MINKILIYVILGLAVVTIGLGMYANNLSNKVITCKANTEILKDRHKNEMKRHDADKIIIADYFQGELDKSKDFKRRDNETDCDASRRFFDTRNYD